jgi:DNA polymerase alpha-associated DNA helicase A
VAFLEWLDAHLKLLDAERTVEVEENALLLSNCPANVLERNGLAILNLGVSNLSIGLGDRTVIELERPAAHHASSTFPPHTFRPGDLARLVDPADKGKGKQKQTEAAFIDGVISRVGESKIVLAVKASQELEVPQRIHLHVILTSKIPPHQQQVQAVKRCYLRSNGEDA